MHKLPTFVLLSICAAAAAFGQHDLGTLNIQPLNKTIPVRVSANDPQLNVLAQQAFESHGRYRLDAGAFAYDIRFSSAGPRSERVDIFKRDGTPVGAEIVPGTSARNALLRAADFAVEKTNNMGLKGFCSSRIVFIGRMTGHPEV